MKPNPKYSRPQAEMRTYNFRNGDMFTKDQQRRLGEYNWILFDNLHKSYISPSHSFYEKIFDALNTPVLLKENSFHSFVEDRLRVELVDGDHTFIPLSHSSWAKAFEDSRYILSYVETDEETGQQTHYEPETWSRSIKLLATIARLAHTKGELLPTPAIYDGDKGSIDVRWKNEFMRLLLNVPVTAKEPVSFHGDSTDGQSVKGKLFDSEDLKNTLLSILKSA